MWLINIKNWIKNSSIYFEHTNKLINSIIIIEEKLLEKKLKNIKYRWLNNFSNKITKFYIIRNLFKHSKKLNILITWYKHVFIKNLIDRAKGNK